MSTKNRQKLSAAPGAFGVAATRLIAIFAFVLAAIHSQPCAAQASEVAPPKLFADSSQAELLPEARAWLEKIHGDTVLYARSVQVNRAVFDRREIGSHLKLNLFAGLDYEAVCTEKADGPQGARIWRGTLVGEPENKVVLILSEDNLLSGYVRVGNREYEIEPTDRTGWHAIFESRAPLQTLRRH